MIKKISNKQIKQYKTFTEKVDKELSDIKELLLKKNKKYGNSALEPINVFSKATPSEGIELRIDDKLKRISNGYINDADEDTLKDLIGYLIIYRIALRENKK